MVKIWYFVGAKDDNNYNNYQIKDDNNYNNYQIIILNKCI